MTPPRDLGAARYGEVMNQAEREQRAAELAARLRTLPADEVSRMALALLVQTAVSLVLQALLLGIGVRTAGQLYRNRHLGRRRLRPIMANKPLVVVSVLSVLDSGLTVAWLTRWVRRLNTETRS